ncbi:baseplate assembly protein [Paraburkholderia sp. JPY432]|nr:baseplate assembly protein [Paraburkholderia youngii]
MPGVRRYYGKYRGVVTNPVDIEKRGRVQVTVPDVYGPNISSWARPCLPWGGIAMGAYSVPLVGANVWVEFEQGLADYPIVVGYWWGSALDTPTTAKTSPPGPVFAIESALQNGVVVSDVPLPPFLPTGGVLLKAGTNYIAVDKTGVRVIAAPVGLSVNINALQVLP